MKFFRSRNKLAEDIAVGPAVDSGEDNHGTEKNVPTVEDDSSLERMPSQDVQNGVKKVEAVTLIWTRNELIFAYAW
jgi:hypothetical protein